MSHSPPTGLWIVHYESVPMCASAPRVELHVPSATTAPHVPSLALTWWLFHGMKLTATITCKSARQHPRREPCQIEDLGEN